MNRIAIAFVLIASLFAMSAMASELAGTISDAKCGMAHVDASEKSMKCAQSCVKGGAAPVFISDGKILKIDSDSRSKVMDHIGHKVVITGSVDGDTVTIESVKMAGN